ncbi:hypothetical protein FBD94_25700 [Pedobacter hiemivivus]|uniref:Uncharacterized protein n=1 Tax=Pedobacter hiemivivus TaxID=2530454 RepID=A0A4U1FWI9_9SPHI|nr:hypothetical protein [Pedobacter hiemivivus]TKC54954.1 hypothetical protein FBD94_25700 [Pedobacter hiemivivus]
MKKLLFVLFLTFACSSIYAQIKANMPSAPVYSNGESYGYYIDEIPGAVSYVWSVEGTSGAIIWTMPWDEKMVDLTFSRPGYSHIYCTVTMSDDSVEVYQYDTGASDE